MAYLYADGRKPRLKVPHGATDTHMHIYEPGYAMAPTALIEPLADGRLDDYRLLQAGLGLERVVVVQPSTYGLDNRCTVDAVAKVGPNARAVVCADPSFTDAQIEELRHKGARGLRFFVMAGGSVGWDVFDEMAARAKTFAMHLQVQFDGRMFPDRLAQLMPHAQSVVIDHVGRFQEPVAVDSAPFKALLRLVDAGAWVKLSAPYESTRSGPPWRDIGALAKVLLKHAPERMVWATNWPHPNQDPRPDDADLLDMLLDWAEDEAVYARVLVDNPARLYGF
jgi:D-galactarolactone isomerase